MFSLAMIDPQIRSDSLSLCIYRGGGGVEKVLTFMGYVSLCQVFPSQGRSQGLNQGHFTHVHMRT